MAGGNAGAAKIGLALGGGTRADGHTSVCCAPSTKAGIVPEHHRRTRPLAPSSAAATSSGKLDELEDFARELTRRRVFSYLDFNLTGTGLIPGQRLGDAPRAPPAAPRRSRI